MAHFVKRLKVGFGVTAHGQRGFGGEAVLDPNTTTETKAEKYVWAMLDAVMGLTSTQLISVTDQNAQFAILKACAAFAAVFTKVVNAMKAVNAAQGMNASFEDASRAGSEGYLVSKGRIREAEFSQLLISRPVVHMLADLNTLYAMAGPAPPSPLQSAYVQMRRDCGAILAAKAPDFETGQISGLYCNIMKCLVPSRFPALVGWSLFVTATRSHPALLVPHREPQDAEFRSFVEVVLAGL